MDMSFNFNRARGLLFVLLFGVALLGGGKARAGEIGQVVLGATSLCAGFGLPLLATGSQKSALPLAIGTCLGVAFPAVMIFGLMETETAAQMLPVITAPMGLMALAATASFLVDGWERSERMRLVGATANGTAFGLGLWLLGGVLLGEENRRIELWHPLALGTAIAAAGLAGAAGFAAGTTDRRSTLLAVTPLIGFFAGELALLTYTIAQAARAEAPNPAVMGAFVAGGLALGSVVGLVLAATSPPALDEPTGELALSPMGLRWTF